MQHTDHQRGSSAGRKLELLAYYDLFSQRYSKHYAEEADTQSPEYELAQWQPQTSCLLPRKQRSHDVRITGSRLWCFARLEEKLQSRYHAYEAATKRHGAY